MTWHGRAPHPARAEAAERRTFGERAADTMRLSMGTWSFLGGFAAVMALWILTDGWGGWDVSPYFRLNLLLSCLAGLQCAILLISAKRADRISAAQSSHDYAVNRAAVRAIRKVAAHLGCDCDAELAEVTHLLEDQP